MNHIALPLLAGVIIFDTPLPKTEELLKACALAEGYKAPVWYPNFKGLPVHVPPQTLKQLVELCQLQHKALLYTNINGFCAEESCGKMEQSIAAFERFEKGE